jgi:hypothetical protein
VLQMEEKLFFTIAFPFGSSLIIVAKKQWPFLWKNKLIWV